VTRKPRVVVVVAAGLLAAYAISYLVFRAGHVERPTRDGSAEVIFPTDARALYLLYRPAAWVDHALTGTNFHIGPHR